MHGRRKSISVGPRAVRLIALATLLQSGVVGCGKKSSDSGAAGSGGTSSTTNSKSSATLAAAIGFDSIPASATVVLSADVTKLRESKLMARGVAQLLERDPELGQRVAALQRECGFDAQKDLTRITIGMGAGAGEVVLIAAGAFSENTIASCLNKAMAAAGGSLTTKTLGTRTFYRAARSGDDPQPVWLTFGAAGPSGSDKSDRTVALSPSREWLEESLGKGAKVSASEAMKPLLAGTDQGAALWGAGRVPAVVGSGLVTVTRGAISAPPTGIYGHLELEDGLAAQLNIVMSSEADANAASSKAVFELGLAAMVAQRFGLGPLISKILASSKSKTVQFSLALSLSELSELLNKLPNSSARRDTAPPARTGVGARGIDQPGQGDQGLDTGGPDLQDTPGSSPK